MTPKSRQEPTVVGHWSFSPDDRALPFPQANPKPWAGQDNFVARLKGIEQGIRERRNGKVTAYRGWSMCRLCRVPNGNEELELDGYRWPSGFLHYVEAHNVRPPDEFVTAILKSER
jgi:hypothetical protein